MEKPMKSPRINSMAFYGNVRPFGNPKPSRTGSDPELSKTGYSIDPLPNPFLVHGQ